MPFGVGAVVVIVAVDVPDVVTVVGLKAAVVPVGSPVALKVTTPVNPLIAPIVAVYVVLPPPGAIVRDDGEALMVKSEPVVIVRVTVLLWTSAPAEPAQE